jgi:hypothetical protein
VAVAKKNASLSPAAALAKAVKLVDQREAELEHVQEAEEELTARLEGGDDTVTTQALSEAQGAIKRAELLLNAARKSVPAAEQAVRDADARDNPTLAHIVADLMRTRPFDYGLYGFTVAVVPEAPSSPDGPAVYLFQTEPTEANPETGVLSGKVRAIIVPPAGVKFRSDRVELGLEELTNREHRSFVSAHTDRHGDEYHVFVGFTDFRPSIPTLTTELSGQWAHALALDVRDLLAKIDQIVETDGWGNHSLVNRPVSSLVLPYRVLREERDKDVLRRVIRVAIAYNPYNLPADFAESAERELAGFVGHFAPGVGVVQEVAAIKVDRLNLAGNDSRLTYGLSCELALACKVAD